MRIAIFPNDLFLELFDFVMMQAAVCVLYGSIIERATIGINNLYIYHSQQSKECTMF